MQSGLLAGACQGVRCQIPDGRAAADLRQRRSTTTTRIVITSNPTASSARPISTSAIKAKLTLGLRYNHDSKFLSARTTYLQDSTLPSAINVLLPYGATDLSQALNYGAARFRREPAGHTSPTLTPASRSDGSPAARCSTYKVTPNNLLYASYSRGYKSGGINPPLSPVFAVPTSFARRRRSTPSKSVRRTPLATAPSSST